MSTVYLAIQLSVAREVALKVMSPVLNADPVFSERFQREANIVGQLSHHNIVSIYDIGRHKNLNYIAMDYLPGGSVHSKMSQGLSGHEAMRITREVAGALHHAHDKGYIHRDIKPENILFRDDSSAVLSDFGVAKTVSSSSRMTNAGTVVGTPHYMSPEQARGKPVDGRSDIYSLGIVFYEMLTGSVPYQAEEAVAIAIKHLTAPTPKLPPQYAIYQKILNKLLAKDPGDRFQCGQDLIDAVDEIEATLTGSRTPHLTATDASGVQILPLFKALALTSYAVIAMQMGKLARYIMSWRWTPKRGIYRRPDTSVTEVMAPETGDTRATIVSTRIQRAAHYQTVSSIKYRIFSATTVLAIVVSLIWAAFSVSLQKLDLEFEKSIPSNIAHYANLTASYILSQDSDPQPEETSAPSEVIIAVPAKAEPSQQSSTPKPLAEKPAEPAPAPKFALQVDVKPENATVRILNIAQTYYPGIPLLPGRYNIEVSFKGYDTVQQWVEIDRAPLTPKFSLRKTPVPGAQFANELKSGGTGPEMVIIPAGSFIMGRNQVNNATPTRKVRIKNPIAVSKFEITFADFERFTAATGYKRPSDNRWGSGSRPVINVSWVDARAYTDWLKNSTGRKYRLPSESEWEYIARAGTSSDYWWGEGGKSAKKANCRRGCDSDYSGIFSGKSAPVGSYQGNSFGIHDTAGNVSEWVQDCFVGHYLNAPRDGSAIEQKDCKNRSIRGGSLKDSSAKLASYMRGSLPENKRESHVGFRVVVDLY